MTRSESTGVTLFLGRCTFEAEDRKYEEIPHKTLVSLWDFFLTGEHPSGFTTACIENDFVAAASKADRSNAKALPAIARHIHSYAPADAWGNKPKVLDWADGQGLIGRSSMEEGLYRLAEQIASPPSPEDIKDLGSAQGIAKQFSEVPGPVSV